MKNPNIIVCEANHVLTIEINRREKKNALTTAMYQAMTEALAQADQDPMVRSVLIRGQEDMFSAGNDLADFLAREPGEPSAAIPFLHQLDDLTKPLVAAVGGNAIGIGTTLLLHCDLVLAAENASFQLPFINLALCPEGASSQLLPLVAGHRLAAELLMLGEPFDSATAQQAGLVGRIVPAPELIAAAAAAATKLAAKPARAMALTKSLMRRTPDTVIGERIDAEAIAFGELLDGPAAREIFAAFVQKRHPDPDKLD